MSTLISALLDAIFGSLAEATGLSAWLRQRLGREPERLAFGAALAQALTDVANEFPGRDLCYFVEGTPQTLLLRGECRTDCGRYIRSSVK